MIGEWDFMSYSSVLVLFVLDPVRWGKSSVQRNTYQRMLIERDKPNFRHQLDAHGEQFVLSIRRTVTISINHRGDIILKAAPGAARPTLCVQVGWSPLNRQLLQLTTTVYFNCTETGCQLPAEMWIFTADFEPTVQF